MLSALYRSLLRPLLFRADPELVHDAVILAARAAQRVPGACGLAGLAAGAPELPTTFSGLRFPNPVGLAAGFDKNCEAAAFLSRLGFGFLELGTVTLRPQPGNPKPRLFRLPEQQAILNRMGFNNIGAEAAARKLERLLPLPIPVGISIGKNADCPLENAPENYLGAFEALYDLGDYFAVNISSPNTAQLRTLHGADKLRPLVEPLLAFAAGRKRPKPVFVKIAPDLDEESLRAVCGLAAELRFGLIAANTTLSRSGLPERWRDEKGGLSGRPVKKLSNEILVRAAELTGGRVPIMASGGVFTGEDALEKLRLGAGLVQVYTGLVYGGPLLPREIVEYLRRSTWEPKQP